MKYNETRITLAGSESSCGQICHLIFGKIRLLSDIKNVMATCLLSCWASS